MHLVDIKACLFSTWMEFNVFKQQLLKPLGTISCQKQICDEGKLISLRLAYIVYISLSNCAISPHLEINLSNFSRFHALSSRHNYSIQNGKMSCLLRLVAPGHWGMFVCNISIKFCPLILYFSFAKFWKQHRGICHATFKCPKILLNYKSAVSILATVSQQQVNYGQRLVLLPC